MFVRPAIASDIGVITACDPYFFPGFQLLFHSLRGVPVTLFNLGLSPAQREWCRERAIPLLTIPLEMPETVHGWQSWNKPLYLEASPYERTLWLDCDCAVRGSLLPLFDAIAERHLILRHWDEQYPIPNKEELYGRLPVRTRFATKRFINAGVMGIRKSRDLAAPWFRAWRGLVAKAAVDADLQAWVSYWDEGALIWALEATASVETITDRQAWNRCVPPADIGGVAGLMQALETPTDDVVWHLSGYPKLWSDPSPPCWLLPEDALAPFDFGTYPHVWRKPEWSVDRRHIYWLYDLLASGRIRTALEIGCLHGATSAAFVEALNRGKLEHGIFCDVEILPALRETLDRCADQERIRIFTGMSVDLLDAGGSFDMVFIDGDHRLEAVSAELKRLLRMRPRCIMAHDTNTTAAGHRDCEGPTYLKHRLQALGWFCLEDSLPRRGERTHRGMFFATTDPDLYEIARASLASRCNVVSAYLPEPVPQPPLALPSLPSPSPRPTAWRQLLRDAGHVVRCKVRKGWLW